MLNLKQILPVNHTINSPLFVLKNLINDKLHGQLTVINVKHIIII